MREKVTLLLVHSTYTQYWSPSGHTQLAAIQRDSLHKLHHVHSGSCKMQCYHFIWYQCSVNNCGQSPKSVVVATHNISCVDRCSIPCFVLLNADWDSTKWLFWHNMVGPLYTVIWCRWNIGSFVDTCQLLTGIHNVTTYTIGDCYYRLHFSRHTSHMCNLCHIYLNSTNSKPDRLSDFYKSSHVHLCHLRCMVTSLLIYLLTS